MSTAGVLTLGERLKHHVAAESSQASLGTSTHFEHINGGGFEATYHHGVCMAVYHRRVSLRLVLEQRKRERARGWWLMRHHVRAIHGERGEGNNIKPLT